MKKVPFELSTATLTVLGVLVLAVVFFAGLSLGSSKIITGQAVKDAECGRTEACVKVVSTPSVEYQMTVLNREGNIIKIVEGTSGNLMTAEVHSLGDNSGNEINGVGSVIVHVTSAPSGYTMPRGNQARSISENEYETIYLDISTRDSRS